MGSISHNKCGSNTLIIIIIIIIIIVINVIFRFDSLSESVIEIELVHFIM